MPGRPCNVVILRRQPTRGGKVRRVHHEPEQQAGHRREAGWYPGIDPTKVLPNVSEDGKQKLFGDIPAETLNKAGLSFPLANYMKDFQAAYEEAK